MTDLPKNSAYIYPSGNRYAKKPWRGRKHKEPQNVRMRCTDCSAQFNERTQETQMDQHCLKMGAGTAHGHPRYGLHHGWISATSRQTNPHVYRIISDSITAMNEWNKENGY